MNIKFEETEKRQRFRMEENKNSLSAELEEYKLAAAEKSDALQAGVSKIIDFFHMDEEPEAPAEPEKAEEPEAPAEPEQAEEPETTAEPEAPAEPEQTEEPEEAEETEVVNNVAARRGRRFV